MEFEVMAAHVYKPPKKPKPGKKPKKAQIANWEHWRVEPKLDGVRVICIVDMAGEPTFYSRNGRQLDMFGHLNKSVKFLYRNLCLVNREYRHGAMLDGEMCGSTFNEIGGAIHRKNHTEDSAVFHIFHAMTIRPFKEGQDDLPQRMRREELVMALGLREIGFPKDKRVCIVRQFAIAGDSEVPKIYERLLKLGYEGAMLKDMSAHWVAKRTNAWLKIKQVQSEDLPIIGWKPGKGKYKGTLGAIIVDRKGKPVRLSGMTDNERNALFKMRKKLESGRMVAEVEFQYVTKGGSLRHPRFLKIRKDKEKLK